MFGGETEAVDGVCVVEAGANRACGEVGELEVMCDGPATLCGATGAK